ncbi:MAG: DnaA regulatory inactivator Hda [Pseudomonadota bacterium]
MRQLPLDLGLHKPQTLDTFVVGQNAELAALLRRFDEHQPITSNERFTYIWGESAAGKSHLLQALAATAKARYIGADATEAAFLYAPDISLYLLDDCEQLSATMQIEAFNLFNQIRENGGVMISAGAMPPALLAVREDLRTRMGWGLIYQLHGLTDEEKIDALTQAAQARGLSLSPGVLPYLMSHFQRDMRSLSTMLDALDQYSLETKRAITLPLLRELLQLESDAKA